MAIYRPLPDLAASDITRFWSFVERRGPDDCWPWKGSKFTGGYGQMKIGPRNVRVHRVAYFIQHGADPLDKPILHSCDFPPCCNGAHLRADTYQANIVECVAKGRANPAHGERHGSRTKPEQWARGERVGSSKLTSDDISEIRRLYSTGALTQQRIADQFGVARETVGVIVRGERWKHLPVDGPNARNIARYNRARPGDAHASAKLTSEQVLSIRRRYTEGGINQRQLATEYNVNLMTVSAIIRRLTWKHLL